MPLAAARFRAAEMGQFNERRGQKRIPEWPVSRARVARRAAVEDP
jgi:hypothetical protein